MKRKNWSTWTVVPTNKRKLARDIGDFVSEARNAHGMTQTDLAKKIRSYPSAISRLESGKQLPSLGTILKIIRVTGVSLTLEPR